MHTYIIQIYILLKEIVKTREKKENLSKTKKKKNNIK